MKPLYLCTIVVTASQLNQVSSRLRKHEIVYSHTESPHVAHFSEIEEVDFPNENLCRSVIAIGHTLEFALDDEIYEVDGLDEEFVCELKDGTTLPIKGTDGQIEELRNLLNNGTLISGETSIYIPATAGFKGISVIEDGGKSFVEESIFLPPGEINLKHGNNHSVGRRLQQSDNDHQQRKMIRLEGEKTVLVVKVIDKDGRSVSDSPAVISDKVFGTGGDKVTMKSQFKACSFDKLHISNEYSVDIDEHLSAPGVIEVNIPISLENQQGTIRGAIQGAVQAKLGFSLPGPFDHVAYVLERCYVACGWAAYAYINSWCSVYQGNYYRHPAVQLHEIGHNLNLAHSGGLDGKTYTDHTCLMGNPMYEDDIAGMCFNPAKNYQIAKAGGWYNENENHYITWDSGEGGGTAWRGSIIGIADYKNNPNDNPFVVKLETGTSEDYFIGFNRAVGINIDNVEADDEVTILKSGSNGEGYAQSFLEATLMQGQSFTVSNWRDTADDLVVSVNEININADPGYADVTVSFGSQPLSVCGDGFCSGDETPLNCNVDCAELIFSTEEPENGYKKIRGHFFTIKAISDVTITSFDIIPKKAGNTKVMVYTIPEDYSGHEGQPADWELVFNKKINVKDSLTNIGEMEREISISAGHVQSFYIWTTKGMQCTKGDVEGSLFTSNDSIVVYVGKRSNRYFSRFQGSGKWNGVIRYRIS